MIIYYKNLKENLLHITEEKLVIQINYAKCLFLHLLLK
jgi:hypothetical protein